MTYVDSAVLDLTEQLCRRFQAWTGRTNVWLAFQLTNLSIVVYFIWAASLYFVSGALALRIFISGLAEHTKNLERDPRASLLVAEGGAADPLANGRVTLLGPCTRVEGDAAGERAAFFAAHSNSIDYADFRDFAFWKLQVDRVRYIGGYGRMSWISKAEWRAADPDPLGPSAAGTIAHMNADHADALVLYCRAFSRATEVTSASMTGVDRYGFDMSAMTRYGPRPVRLAFTRPVSTPEEVRAALISMVQDARSRLG